MEQTKLSQIEKKMEMSLDDIIKQNRSRPAASGGAKGSGKASAARAPLVMKKGQASKAQAPKTLVKSGIAGKRQAIQQKKVAPKSLAGARPRPALTGGVNKATGGIKRGAGGGGYGQSMAQKIISRARNAKQQQAPKQLAKTRTGGQKAQMAPKQLAAPKQQRKQIQFSGLNKPLQTARQQSAPKSLAQTMNQRRRGGDMAGGQRGAPVGKQNSARAPVHAGGQRRGGGAAPPMQLNRPMQGGVRKRGGPQARAPLFQNQRQAAGNQRQMGGWPAAQQQQMPRRQMQMQQSAPVLMRRGPMPRGQFAPVGQFRPLQPAANPVLLARQQAVIQAVRLQKLEEERNRAERKAFIHQSMQMMGGPPARAVANRAPIQPAMGRMGGGMGLGGGAAMRGMGGGGAYEQRGYEQRRYSGYA